DFDAFIGCGDPEGRGAATRDARDREALRIHFRSALEVIEGADPIPAFDSRGRIAPGLPPPTIVAVSAMVNPGDLAQLQRVDDQTHIPMGGKPHPVMLKGGLITVATFARMTADVKDGRKFGACRGRGGQIEVACDVQMRAALEMQLLDAEPFL